MTWSVATVWIYCKKECHSIFQTPWNNIRFIATYPLKKILKMFHTNQFYYSTKIK